MALVIEITNPFQPLKDAKRHEAENGSTIWEWLQVRFPGFKAFDIPTICLLNNEPLMQAEWKKRKIKENDIVTFSAMPGDPVTALYVIVGLLIVSTVVLAVNMKTDIPVIGQTPEADPVYSLKGQRNQIRLGEPIEVPYGRTRMWPSLGAIPYNKYQNNQQWLYQLFCLGQGQFIIEDVFIEDTPISNFQDVEYEIVQPGGQVTLFPDNVVTSVEVANMELFGPNEPESGGTYIIDSEGDDEFGFPETGHYGYVSAGPFIVNPAFTQTNKIELDVALPRGLYKQSETTAGALEQLSVAALFEAREVDDNGDPTGDWFTLNSFSKTLATITPQRFTVEAEVDLGRYEVRAARTNNKDTSSRAGNTLYWEGVRAFLPSTRVYGEVTMLAFKGRGSNNLNDNAANRINVVGVRMLPTWDVEEQEWTDPQPTRSPVWAFCDIFRAQYGGKLVDSYLDLDALAAKDAELAERQEFFDWIYDQRITVWDAAKLAALVGRGIPMLNGSRVAMVCDEPKSIPTAIFNPQNMVKGSFKWDIKLHTIDAYDGLEVEYIDSVTWKSETVPCILPGEAGDNLEKVKLNGCTSRQHAYTWGMWRRATLRYLRENITFATGLEGHIPSYGDLITVSHDVPKWGKSGFVEAIDGTSLSLTEPVTFEDEVLYKIVLRKKSGEATEPLAVTAGVNEFEVILAEALDDESDFSLTDLTEPPLFIFGPSSEIAKDCKVTNLIPADDDTVEIHAVPYREEPYSFDEYLAPAPGDTNGYLARPFATPSVTGLIVNPSPGQPTEVIATWNAAQGAIYYVVQFSYDGTSWEDPPGGSRVETTSLRFNVHEGYLYVRVAANVTGIGVWAYWTGDAPVEKSNIVYDNGVDPDPVTSVTIASIVEGLVLRWVNPTNTPLKGVHIYVSEDTTKPELATIFVTAPQNFFFHNDLADGVTRYYWFEVEGTNLRLSTIAGPFSGTVVTWPVVDDIYSELAAEATARGAAIAAEEVARAAADVAIQLEVDGNAAAIISEAATREAADSAEASTRAAAIAALETADSTIIASVSAESTARAAGDAAEAVSRAAAVAALESEDASLLAAITSEETARIAADAANASSISSVSASVATAQGTADAAVTAASSAQAGVNSIAAEYVLLIETSGGGVDRIAGFRVTNQGGAGGASEFIIQADKIALVNTTGDNQKAPFALDGGITYINTAMIKNASITNAMIADLLADKITAGTLAAMTLTASKTQTDSSFFNSGAPANDMPAFCVERDFEGSNAGNKTVGTYRYSTATVNGWSIGTGFAKRFGKSTTIFTVSIKGSFTVTSTYYGDLSMCFRINGGSWTDFSASSRATAFDGGAEVTDSVEISGLSGSDVIEFGIKIVVGGGTIYYGNAQMSVMWGNV